MLADVDKNVFDFCGNYSFNFRDFVAPSSEFPW